VFCNYLADSAGDCEGAGLDGYRGGACRYHHRLLLNSHRSKGCFLITWPTVLETVKAPDSTVTVVGPAATTTASSSTAIALKGVF
jgi:hypothetical protein